MTLGVNDFTNPMQYADYMTFNVQFFVCLTSETFYASIFTCSKTVFGHRIDHSMYNITDQLVCISLGSHYNTDSIQENARLPYNVIRTILGSYNASLFPSAPGMKLVSIGDDLYTVTQMFININNRCENRIIFDPSFYTNLSDTCKLTPYYIKGLYQDFHIKVDIIEGEGSIICLGLGEEMAGIIKPTIPICIQYPPRKTLGILDIKNIPKVDITTVMQTYDMSIIVDDNVMDILRNYFEYSTDVVFNLHPIRVYPHNVTYEISVIDNEPKKFFR